MSPQEVAQHLCKSFDEFFDPASHGEQPSGLSWEGLRAKLFTWIQAVEADCAFDGLFQVLETQTRYQYQWLAGDLLLRAAIPCRVTLDKFITRVAPRFNSSAETVPHYLASIFRAKVVIDALRQIRVQQSTSEYVREIDSMLYHLGEHPAHS